MFLILKEIEYFWSFVIKTISHLTIFPPRFFKNVSHPFPSIATQEWQRLFVSTHADVLWHSGNGGRVNLGCTLHVVKMYHLGSEEWKGGGGPKEEQKSKQNWKCEWTRRQADRRWHQLVALRHGRNRKAGMNEVYHRHAEFATADFSAAIDKVSKA